MTSSIQKTKGNKNTESKRLCGWVPSDLDDDLDAQIICGKSNIGNTSPPPIPDCNLCATSGVGDLSNRPHQ